MESAEDTMKSGWRLWWRLCFWVSMVSFVIIAGAAGYYYRYLRGFGEASCKRDSWAFSRWIRSPEVRAFPVVKPTDDPVYHYRTFSEVGAPPYESITYFSREEEKRLMDTLTAYLPARGFRQSEKRASFGGGIRYVKNGVEFDLIVKKCSDGSLYVCLRALNWEVLGVKDEEGMDNY
jgi:hypothetical protein